MPKDGNTTTPELNLGIPSPGDLRDYFAAKAMQAIITSGDYKNGHVASGAAGKPNIWRDLTPAEIAAWADEIADAMLEERAKD